ncbi:hypothetical protein RJ639_020943 [Escallonia herrerae]|uniref:Uncharacterized protein n=1 Tax=Escallonia herrerae TaxID=1293975 RepID=A0AA88V3B8_9ASTE|nr:hypothetical protein RJ639_020943 [Escallonia herrerae]
MKAIKEEHDDAERRKHIRILEARKHADYLTLLDGSDLLQNKKQKASGPLEKAFNVVERSIADKRASRIQNSRGKWTPRGEAYAVVAVQRNVLSLNL